MRRSLLGIAACWASVLIVASCTSRSDKPAAVPSLANGLGDISAGRCLYFAEGEDFREKAGGAIDFKGAASQGKCLGMRWGANATDFATYDFDLKETSKSTLLVIRAACEGTLPQFYSILIDRKPVRTAIINPTGGYGYTEKEWKCFSVALWQVTQGPHILTIRPIKSDQIVNIDCLALGR